MRRRQAEKRSTIPDSRFGNAELARFINRLMLDGKKSIAKKAVYDAIDKLESETNEPGLEVFKKSIRRVMPSLEVRPRRVGGATYQIPIEVRPERREALAQRWIINAVRARKGRPLADKVYQELLEAYRGTGTAVKRKEDTHRMAEANRAFSHYRW